jgi:hypothetical protein
MYNLLILQYGSNVTDNRHSATLCYSAAHMIRKKQFTILKKKSKKSEREFWAPCCPNFQKISKLISGIDSGKKCLG